MIQLSLVVQFSSIASNISYLFSEHHKNVEKMLLVENVQPNCILLLKIKNKLNQFF